MEQLNHFLQGRYPDRSVKAVLELLEDGCSVPFIARYRKEKTGSLEDTAILEIESAHKQLLEHQSRQNTILKAIKEQGALTEELENRIINCFDPRSLEDLYLPYKKRKKTRADRARELGLEGLARVIMSQRDHDPKVAARQFISGKVQNTEEALQGAMDIIAEWINTDTFIREGIRQRFEKHGVISSKVRSSKAQEGQKFRDYFDYKESLRLCPSHRFLAVMRGESEGILITHILPDEDRTIEWIIHKRIRNTGPCRPYLEQAIQDAYKRLLAPSIQNQVKQIYKEKADREAILVFAQNLEQLLMAPPLGEKRILALDPGYRTGCKLVCLSATGDLLHHDTIFPHPPQSDRQGAYQVLKESINRFEPEAIAIGDGTAGRETLDWFRSTDLLSDISAHLVNESGASIYSASEIAREEFPDKDVTVRGAVSIGRRLMDPLAELIKIDPRSIGVGQYQHDVNQNWLSERLDQVVKSCVNKVGVNINTASATLLAHVSGLGPALAENIVQYRNENGAFTSRSQIRKVDRLGPKAYEQCSGFLRIRHGSNPLDNTGVHPESYDLVERICEKNHKALHEIIANEAFLSTLDPGDYTDSNTGLPTVMDIIKELKKPGLDVRGEIEEFEFLDNIRTFEDIREGMSLPGIVRNITNFGAFVDIGIKEAGLVHVSEISDTFIRHPGEKLILDQKVKVLVIGLDQQRRRIQLSIKRAVPGQGNKNQNGT